MLLSPVVVNSGLSIYWQSSGWSKRELEEEEEENDHLRKSTPECCEKKEEAKNSISKTER